MKLFEEKIFCLLVCISFFSFAWGGKEKSYCIKEGYVARTAYSHCDLTEDESECQEEVYILASKLALQHDFKKIVDLGCGSAYKLFKYFSDFYTIGYELEPAFSWLERHYHNRDWRKSNHDFTMKLEEPVDLIICSDVIEHLLDPDILMKWLESIDCKMIVISTPDRDKLEFLRKSKENGPPLNKHHIREWNFKELKQYVSQWFNVVDHVHTKREWWGQVIVVKK